MKSFLTMRFDWKVIGKKQRSMDSKRNLDGMKKNLTRFQVRKLWVIQMIKGDLNPNIDQVYHYHGDLDADGKEEHAKSNSIATGGFFESPF